MSEQNILNPTQTDPMNPDYGYTEGLPEMHADFQGRGGKAYRRRVMTEGRRYQLGWLNRSAAQAKQLRQWAEQYASGFFSYQDFERARYFSGRFAAPLVISPSGNNQWNLKADFVELPGLPMFQYPSDWAGDGILVEERDDFGSDLVKLTGAAWDRRTKNYALYSEALDNAVWTPVVGGGAANPVVTADASGDPNGNATAEQIAFPLTAGAQSSSLRQNNVIVPAVKGQTFTFSIWLKAVSGATVIRILIEDAGNSANNAAFVCNLTGAWQRFSVTYTSPLAPTSANLGIFINQPASSAAVTLLAWGAQLEYGAAASTYTSTGIGGIPVALPAPLGHALEHGGFGYWHPGNNAIDAAEWEYFGYGFQLYALTNVDMGIMQVSCTALDGTVELAATNVDLYTAAAVASAVVLTNTNMKLGMHRVKLAPTNTKNGASSSTIVIADAIGVMR